MSIEICEFIDFNRLYYKKCGNALVTLALTPSSKLNDKRTNIINPEFAKLRTDKVAILDIEDITTGEKLKSIHNTFYFDKKIEYKVLTIIIEPNYDLNLDNVCAPGIHIFKSRERAKTYSFNDKIPDGYTGVYTSYYDNGAIKYKTNVINGKYWFECYAYDEFGVLVSNYNYINGVLHGKYYKYKENKLWKEGSYDHGLFHGTIIEYDPETNEKINLETFNKGNLHGPFFYIEDGVEYKGYYMDNVKIEENKDEIKDEIT